MPPVVTCPTYDRRTLTDAATLRVAVGIIAGKWVVPVLTALDNQRPRRQAWIRSRVGPVSPKVLTETLRRMNDTGIITRVLLDDAVGVGYTLTPADESLLDALAVLQGWIDTHRGQLVLPNRPQQIGCRPAQ